MNKLNNHTLLRWLWTAAKIAISCCLVLWLSRKISYTSAARHLLHADALKIFVAIIIYGISNTITAFRWHFSSTRLITLPMALRYTWISQFYGLFLPGLAAVDIAKGVAMTTNRDSPCITTVTVSILLERLAGISSIVILGLLAHSFQPFFFPVAPTLTAIAALISFVVVASFPLLFRLCLRPFREKTRLHRLHEIARRLNGRLWSTTLALSFLIVATNVTFYWMVYLAVGGGADWVKMGTYTCLDNLSSLLPVSIAGIGIRDSLSVALFAKGGAGTHEVAFAWVVLMIMVIHGLIGLLLQCRFLRLPQRS